MGCSSTHCHRVCLCLALLHNLATLQPFHKPWAVIPRMQTGIAHHCSLTLDILYVCFSVSLSCSAERNTSLLAFLWTTANLKGINCIKACTLAFRQMGLSLTPPHYATAVCWLPRVKPYRHLISHCIYFFVIHWCYRVSMWHSALSGPYLTSLIGGKGPKA